MEQIRDFTKGPILGPLLAFSMPILLALFLQALYGAVDLLVVGKYALAQDVSGVAVGCFISGWASPAPRWRRSPPALSSTHISAERRS